MAKVKYKKPKDKKTVAKKPPKERKDPRIQEIYEEIVEFTCPVRGLVKQKVKVKRFKSLADQQQGKHLVVSISDLVEKLDEKDDGLAIYSDGEELGLADSKEGE